jgi:hypothetical protein
MAFLIIFATLYVASVIGFGWWSLYSKTVENWLLNDTNKREKYLADFDQKQKWFPKMKSYMLTVIIAILLWCVPIVGGILSVVYVLNTICIVRASKKRSKELKRLLEERIEQDDLIKIIAAAPEPDSPENTQKFSQIVIDALSDVK